MKRNFKRVLALGITLCAVFQFTACKRSNAKDTLVEQKEFVYVPEYQELTGVEYINVSSGTSKGIYYSSSTYDEESQTSKTSIYFLDAGTKEVREVPVSLQEGGENVSFYIQQMQELSDGNLAVIQSIYKVTDPETYEGTQSYVLSVFSTADGSEISSTDLTSELNETENSYIQYMAVDGSDNIYLANDKRIWVYDRNGSKLFHLDVAAEAWLNGFGTSKEGQVVYVAQGQSQNGLEINVIDPAKKGVSRTCTKDVPDAWGNQSIAPGFQKGVLLNGRSGLIEYDLDTETAEPVLDWLDSDINRDNISAYSALEDGRILVLTHDYSSEKRSSEVVYLTKTASSEVAEKEILTLGVMYASSDVNSAVINFNKKSDKYRISVVDYSSGGGDDAWERGMLKLNNDLSNGNGPDIFDLTSVNVKMLAQKGIIEDLNPYLEKDEQISREDFFESVLNAYSIDGKLYSIPNSFYVSTVVGKTSEVGDKPGWTLDDLMALIESKPEGTEVFDYATKEYILQTCLTYSMDEFINWETGECNLNSEEFLKVLNFANTFDSEWNYDEEAPSAPSKIQSGQLLLMATSFSSVQDYQMYLAMFQEPITTIGYPCTSGTGSSVSGQFSYAISAKSGNKDAAWEFLRSFLVPEYYENESHIWGFPTSISAFDKQMEKDMEAEYYEDENGEQVEVSKGGWGWDDFHVDLYAATQEQVDQIRELINNCDRIGSSDSQLNNIISEEAAPFFEGQKSAQEAADIIQSRVQVYVNENR